jgi:hypothetical protein
MSNHIRTVGEALAGLPTLADSGSESLKVQTAGVRVWLSRMTTADGADPREAVSVEARVWPQPKGSPEWHTIATTRADTPLRILDLAMGLDGPPAMVAHDLARIIRAEVRMTDPARP